MLLCRQRHCTQSGPCISWESLFGQHRKQILVCEVLSLSTLLQVHYRHYLRKCVQIRTKGCETRFFICKINLVFLRSSTHFNCDRNFAVIVFFLKESAHGFNNICNVRVKTRPQIVKVWRVWKFFVKKIFPPWQFVTLMGRIFLELQPPIDLPVSVALVKSLWRRSVYCVEAVVKMHLKTNLL